MKINQIIETHLDEIDRRGFLRGLGAAGAAAAVPGLAKAQSQTVPPLYLKAVNDIKAYLKPRLDKLPSPMIQYKKGIIVVKMTDTKVVGAEMKESTGVPKLDDYIIRVIAAAGSFPQVQPLGRTGDHVMEFTTNNLLPAPGEESKKHAQQEPVQQPAQQPVQQNQTPESELSQYSVKGVRFGMTKEQLQAQGLEVFGNSFSGSLRISIGGIGQWITKFRENKLVELYSFPKSNLMYEMVETFKEGYGKPQIREFKSRTKGGLELDDFSATWLVKDAVISMNKHIDRDTGAIFIGFKPHLDKEAADRRAEKEKKSKDF